ncbi:MAG: sigma-54 dependent transcriptional regulator [Candidatus Marinimicrobia bacterium]|nr:sigma-54 dependent transcriptional regulator [Candidatus Neomarinimicrobiota bacterium]
MYDYLSTGKVKAVPNNKKRIMVVDDDRYICSTLVELFQNDGFEMDIAYTGTEAVDKFSNSNFDLVLLDINLPKMTGLEVLREIRRLEPDVAVIMATAKADVATIVESIKAGAENYITKPYHDFASLRAIVQKALENKAVRDENRYLRSRMDFKSRISNIIGRSPKMLELYKMIEKIAPLDTTVLLAGETGTGKELLAQAIHHLSRRSNNRFISINCGGIPETLLESTLFGYEKGAFTGAYKRTRGVFEEADGGTLFLDEIGETSPALQVRLLRVLQSRTFQRVGGTETLRSDVRFISATNKDLLEEIKQKNFREDLYYRINVISLFIPSLKERIDDLPLLVQHFVHKYAVQHEKPVTGIDPALQLILARYAWPGNVRELENVIERAVVLCENETIKAVDLPDYISTSPGITLNPATDITNYHTAKQAFEKTFLSNILEKHNWNISRVAAAIGTPRQNLYLKIKKHRLKR